MTKTKSRFNDGLPEILFPMYDLIFKLIFAKRPDLLRPFLKCVTGLSDEELEEIVVVDPHIYPEHEGGKMGVMDIKVILRSKKVINVEMQKEKFAYLRERIVSYSAGAIRDQMVSGDDYEKIRRVITITADPLIMGDDAYHHRYTLYDPKTSSEFTDLIEIHILELSKLPKTDDGSELWTWLKYILVKVKEQLKMIAEKGPIFAKAAARLLEVSEDEQTRCRLENIRRFEMDNRVRLKVVKLESRQEGIETGMEKGIEIGIEKGMAEERERAAMAMKSEGMNVNTISRVTGLSVDDILRL